MTDFKEQAHVKKLANKILKRLAKPFIILGKKVFISASIGISTFPEDAKTAEMLISHADKAMYMAKDDGRNNAKFFYEINN